MSRRFAGLVLAPALAIGVALGVGDGGTARADKVVRITAKKFEFEPAEITLKKGEEVVIELTTLDRSHGFKVPALGWRVEALPGETVRLRVTPDKEGSFEVTCDVFCGEGHEEMEAKIVVVE
jgi:cytochrome c oxidase subunit 2